MRTVARRRRRRHHEDVLHPLARPCRPEQPCGQPTDVVRLTACAGSRGRSRTRRGRPTDPCRPRPTALRSRLPSRPHLPTSRAPSRPPLSAPTALNLSTLQRLRRHLRLQRLLRHSDAAQPSPCARSPPGTPGHPPRAQPCGERASTPPLPRHRRGSAPDDHRADTHRGGQRRHQPRPHRPQRSVGHCRRGRRGRMRTRERVLPRSPHQRLDTDLRPRSWSAHHTLDAHAGQMRPRGEGRATQPGTTPLAVGRARPTRPATSHRAPCSPAQDSARAAVATRRSVPQSRSADSNRRSMSSMWLTLNPKTPTSWAI